MSLGGAAGTENSLREQFEYASGIDVGRDIHRGLGREDDRADRPWYRRRAQVQLPVAGALLRNSPASHTLL